MYAAYVAGTQEELNVHGYDAGIPDGVLTAKTEAAIRQYQRDAGLPVDGCATKALLDHMKFVLPKVERPRREDAEPIVVEIQTLLTRRGYYLGPVDGIPGRRTQAAAARFAEHAGIATSGAIDRELAEQIKSADPGVRGDRGAAR
jgi:peptidoglycan hydrolase-like protein with peptidoglycan-binding domain